MKRFSNECIEISGWGYPIGEATNRDASSFNLLPISNKSNPPRTFESSKHHLR